MEKYAADVADCVMQKANKTCRDLRQDVKMETKVENVDLRDIICQMAEQLCADLVVVGSHGYGGIKSFVLNDPLSVLDSWNYEDETPCSWTGITCTQLGSPSTSDMFRVTSLVLPNSQLLGSVSPELGSLKHFQKLDLSNNLFNGYLPVALFNASELQFLSLCQPLQF
ncbi:hypothetical protein ACFX2B_012480 [Malus domestica]